MPVIIFIRELIIGGTVTIDYNEGE